MHPFYHPTSVVVVDYDPMFLGSFSFYFEDSFLCHSFTDPKRALEFVGNRRPYRHRARSIMEEAGEGVTDRAGRSADTADTPAHVPLWRFDDPAGMALPAGCRLVGIEIHPDAAELPSFRHPLSAAYVLGPERSSLSPALLARCDHLVRIPTRFSLNLAVAGALVLYDRLLQHGRFADRPVMSGGAGEAPPVPTGHGHPVFRRNRPAWLGDGPVDAGGDEA